MQWDILVEPWLWLVEQLGNPGKVRALAFLLLCAAIVAVVLFLIAPWLIRRHFVDVTAQVLAQHDMRFRAYGIPQAPLKLIAKCIGWVFALKLCSEMLEPVASITLPRLAERHWSVSRYDWIVLAALIVLVMAYWVRFMIGVWQHDASRFDSRIDRTRWRAVPLFWKPAILLLVLLFLPDIGRKATSIAAETMRDGTVPLAAWVTDNRQFEKTEP